MERLLDQPFFKDFFSELSDSERQEFDEHLLSGNIEILRKWIKDHRSSTLEGQSAIALRKMASEMGIYYYNTLSREQLIYKIRKIRRQGQ